MLSKLHAAGVDGLALKPTQYDLCAVPSSPVETLVIDYEGRGAFPDSSVLMQLATEYELYVTTPVRADGFDPLGDDSYLDRIPSSAKRVLVAGNPAYLTDDEQQRKISPRLKKARQSDPSAWIGTEGIEPLANRLGGTHFELLGPALDDRISQRRDDSAIDQVAVYAPMVITDDADQKIAALGEYVSRRDSVRSEIPEVRSVVDMARGRIRKELLEAIDQYALAGSIETIHRRITDFHANGVDQVIVYPATNILD